MLDIVSLDGFNDTKDEKRRKMYVLLSGLPGTSLYIHFYWIRHLCMTMVSSDTLSQLSTGYVLMCSKKAFLEMDHKIVICHFYN